MNILKKRLLCAVMALAVILTCVVVPNKAEAKGANFAFGNVKVDCVSTPDLVANTYKLKGYISAGYGIDKIAFTLKRKQDNYTAYRSTTLKCNGETSINLESPEVFRRLNSTFSENMWGDYQVYIFVYDKSGNKELKIINYSVKKDLGSYMAGLYKNFLRRDPDSTGYNNNVRSVSNYNVTIEGMVRGFYYGPEYQGKSQPSNEEFVKSLYRGILGRNYDTSGYRNYVNALNSGKSRSEILESFLTSNEFKNTVIPNFDLRYHE